jgi:phosphate acetyltransferase
MGQFSVPGSQLQRLLAMAEKPAPVKTAVVHPVDLASMQGVIEAAEQNLIDPILVGPRAKIEIACTAAGVSVAMFPIVDTEHSHAAAAAACMLALKGEAKALMKGALHTDELLEAVVARDGGLRTDRRMSHVFVMDVPTYPRPIFITDAAVNIAPSLAEKRDIAQNAIDCAHALGVPEPRVAILAAVETVNPSMQSTLDAAALCKMADRGQIKGGVLDGPLAFDNAVSEAAAKAKGIESLVAGRADVLLVPDIEAGNMLAKQLTYLANAQSAGVLLGARVPVVLTSRADGTLTRLASCAAALLIARWRERTKAA